MSYSYTALTEGILLNQAPRWMDQMDHAAPNLEMPPRKRRRAEPATDMPDLALPLIMPGGKFQWWRSREDQREDMRGGAEYMCDIAKRSLTGWTEPDVAMLEDAPVQAAAAATEAQPAEPVTWYCPRCNRGNFGDRAHCREATCNHPKSSVLMERVAEHAAFEEFMLGLAKHPRPEDWTRTTPESTALRHTRPKPPIHITPAEARIAWQGRQRIERDRDLTRAEARMAWEDRQRIVCDRDRSNWLPYRLVTGQWVYEWTVAGMMDPPPRHYGWDGWTWGIPRRGQTAAPKPATPFAIHPTRWESKRCEAEAREALQQQHPASPDLLVDEVMTEHPDNQHQPTPTSPRTAARYETAWAVARTELARAREESEQWTGHPQHGAIGSLPTEVSRAAQLETQPRSPAQQSGNPMPMPAALQQWKADQERRWHPTEPSMQQ